MKVNHWTLALAAAGVVSFGAVAQADEANEQVKTLVSGTTISGYVSTSAIWSPGTGGNTAVGGARPGQSFIFGKEDGFNLDVIDLTISKSLDESEWAAGYNAELWFGPDGPGLATIASGDMAIKNAYVALRAPVGNGIDLKMGVFDTVVGFESANAGDNPNYTRSYGWGVEPTTHTGLLASYRVNDMFSVSAGMANTYGPVINGKTIVTAGSESTKAYIGSVTFTAPDGWGFFSGSALTFGVIDAANIGGVNNGQDTVNLYAGLAMNTPIEAWKVGIAYDYRANGGATVAASEYVSVWGLYNTYQATEKLKFTLRAEYVSATGGTFYGTAATDDDGNNKLFGLTGTVDYSLWENVISRLEFRWDSVLTGGGVGGDQPYGGSFVAPTPADEKNAILVALNVIYKF